MTLNGAIKQLHELRSAEDMPIYYKPVIAEVINVLLMDTQEVRHGHWEIKESTLEKQTFDECVCSACGAVEYFNVGWRKFPYCPNCGAKMDGGDS